MPSAETVLREEATKGRAKGDGGCGCGGGAASAPPLLLLGVAAALEKEGGARGVSCGVE